MGKGDIQNLLIIFLLVLSITLIIFAIVGIIYQLFFTLRIKAKSTINKLVPFIIFSLEFSVCYECLRILVFLGILPYMEIYDYGVYFIIILFTLLSFYGAYQLQEILTIQSGNRLKGDEIVRKICLIFAFGFFIASIFALSKSTPIELGYFEFVVNPIFSICLTACYSPLFIYIFIGLIKLQRNIKNKRMKRQTILAAIYLGFFLLNRFGIIGFLQIGQISLFSMTNQLITLLILHVVGLLFIFIYADFFDSVSSHFCVKSIYILKNTGEMLCGYNFHEEESEILITSDQVLLIDFIYAISNGLKIALNLDKNVDEVEIGDRTIIIKHSVKLIIVLLVSDHSEKIHQRVVAVIKDFEENYKNELDNWKENISKFHSEKTQEILFNIFK